MNRKFVFLTLVLIGWVAILYKTIDIDYFYKKNVVMKVFFKDDMPSDNTMESIKNIFYYGSKGFKHEVKVDQISFYVKDEMLGHPHLRSISKLNLKKDFFLDFEIAMDVLKEGSYDFTVKTNEAVGISLDNKEVATFDESKESKENKVTLFLSKGHHSLNLVYFQAMGSTGLEARYKPAEANTPARLIGEDTDSISFSGITQ